MDDATETIAEYVDRNYGDLITNSKPLHYTKERFWVSELKSDYPRFIHDDKNPKTTIVKYIMLRQLGEVRLTDDNQIDGTSRNEVVSRLNDMLQQWRETVEGIVLSSSSDKLAHIGSLKDVLNPIVVAVDHFSREDIESLTYEEIRKDARSKIMFRWLRFLSQLKILEDKEEEDRFTYGPKFAELEKQVGKNETLTNTIISYVMREYYPSVRQILEISRFDPYLHMETCYYAPCIQAGRLLYRREESLLALYHKWYGRFADYRLRPILGQLENVGLIRKEGQYWYGSEDTWLTLGPLKKQVPLEIAPIRA